MAKIKILMVDDHAIMRDGIRALLDLQEDMEIIGEAADGNEAIEKALKLKPEIIMDLAISGLDGLEATRRRIKKMPQAKILVLTQHDNKEYIVATIKAGVAGYVPKRALGKELVSAIYAICKGDSFLYPSVAAALIESYRRQIDEEPYDRLTSREREVLKLIAEGSSSREIAEKLYISLKMVMGHRTKVMGKLGIHNRTELIKFALRKGLVSMD